MKYLLFMGLAVYLLLGGAYIAEGEEQKADAKVEEVVIDTSDMPASGQADRGMEEERAVEDWQDYDENTGLPNVVASDSAYEFE